MYELLIPDLIPEEVIQALSEEAVNEVVANIADGARAFWIQAAQDNLHTSRVDYIASIQPTVHKPGIALLSLVGQPAVMIEQGSNRVDMREWLLGSRVPEAAPGQKGKRRSKAGHFYRAIPIRHGVPTSTGGRVGPAMGDPYKGVVDDSKALGRGVYRQAKQLGPGDRLTAGARYGRGKGKTVPLLRAHHKTDIYAGMVKLRGAYNKVVQSQYTTFRMISTNPERHPDSWIRPDTRPGANLVEQVVDYINRVAPQAFEAYVNQIGK